jgi:hypothetical protein
VTDARPSLPPPPRAPAGAFLLLRRKLRGADVFARRGKRTLVIADVPWVHQSLEIYVSKLFALSYGDNGLEVHGSNPVDSLVHRFTHRVQRGVLIALGRPDGRISSMARNEGACLLAAMQAAAIQNMGTGPEIFSLGHNTYQGNPSAIREHVVLPTHRRPFMCEFLAKAVLGGSGGGGDLESVLAGLGAGQVVSTFQSALAGNALCDRCARQPARKECLQCGSSYCMACHFIVHLQGKPAMREHRPIAVSAAMRMRMSAQRAQRRLLARAGVTPESDAAEEADAQAAGKVLDYASFGAGAGGAFPRFGALAGATLLKGHGALLRVSGAPLGFHHGRTHLAGVAATRARDRWRAAIRTHIWAANPWKTLILHTKRMALAADGEPPVSAFTALYHIVKTPEAGSKAVLGAEAVMKDLFEGRFASFERYIGFLVMFHAMALRVSVTSWPLPGWDISRSQSILRVASTAAPVSGAEVAHQLAGEPASMAFVLPARRAISGRLSAASDAGAAPRSMRSRLALAAVPADAPAAANGAANGAAEPAAAEGEERAAAAAARASVWALPDSVGAAVGDGSSATAAA